ncbi:MAG: MarR family transcriptional regulator [Gemmatimonadota bacterium]|nr:MAG: MarR family transcriptional regulator [Gemmatimonadota bacterium]
MKTQRQGGFFIAKIHQLAGRIFTRKLKEYNIEINPAQGRIMFVLWREGEIPINELAQKTSLGKSTLTSMLDRLEASGFITRVPSKKDRRKILVRRTEKDRAFQDLYVQVSQDMTKLYYKGFLKEEIDRFEQYLMRIFDNLTTYEKSG